MDSSWNLSLIFSGFLLLTFTSSLGVSDVGQRFYRVKTKFVSSPFYSSILSRLHPHCSIALAAPNSLFAFVAPNSIIWLLKWIRLQFSASVLATPCYIDKTGLSGEKQTLFLSMFPFFLWSIPLYFLTFSHFQSLSGTLKELYCHI